MLSASDIAFYREQGYLVVPDVLDATTLDTVRREMARILEGARAVTTHTDMYDLEPGHRPDDPRVRRVKTPHRFFPIFQQLLRHPRLVAVLQDLLGPSLRLHRLQDQSQVAALWLAGGVAPGLGVLSAHQRRPPRGGGDARRLHERQRPAHGGAGQSSRARSSITMPTAISAEPSIPRSFATRSRARCPSPAARAP